MTRLLALTVAISLFVPGCSHETYDWDSKALLVKPSARVPTNVMRIRLDGSLFKRITGEELGQGIRGADISIDPVMGVSSGGGEYFHSDGKRYFKGRHRVGPDEGTYVALKDRICTTARSHSECFALFRNERGAFLRLPLDERSLPARVLMRKIEKPYYVD